MAFSLSPQELHTVEESVPSSLEETIWGVSERLVHTPVKSSPTPFTLSDAKVAEQLRSQGNALFGKQRYKEAVSKYTEGIVLIRRPLPQSACSTAAKLYNNRAAAWLHINGKATQGASGQVSSAHAFAFVDSYRALTYDSSYGKPVLRLAELAWASGHWCPAAWLLLQAQAITPLSKTLRKRLTQAQSQKSCSSQGSDRCRACWRHMISSMCGHPPQHEERIVHKSLSVCRSPDATVGRFVVAQSPVKAGAQLVQEEPFAAVLRTEHLRKRCSYCFVELTDIARLPCGACGNVMYCSPICCDSDTFHVVECNHPRLHEATDVGRLAVRCALRLACHSSDSKDNASAPADAQMSLTPKDESAVAALVQSLGTHRSHVMTKYPTRFRDLMFEAFAMTRVLGAATDVHGTLSSVWGSDCLGDTEQRAMSFKAAGTLPRDAILKMLLTLQTNVYAVTTVESAVDSTEHKTQASNGMSHYEQRRLAVALYPSSSLLNHSCQPNTLIRFSGRRIEIKAVKHIGATTEVANCYGPHVGHMTVAQRRSSLLEQYFFHCQCQPCVQEANQAMGDTAFCHGAIQPDCEGVLVNLASNKQGTVSAVTCRKCHAEVPFIKFQKLLQFEERWRSMQAELSSALDAKVADNVDVRTMTKCLQVAETIFHPMAKELASTHDLVARWRAILGDVAGAIEYVKKSLSIISHLFGEEAVECAREHSKLASLYWSIGDTKAAHTHARQALPVLKLYDGVTSETRDLATMLVNE